MEIAAVSNIDARILATDRIEIVSQRKSELKWYYHLFKRLPFPTKEDCNLFITQCLCLIFLCLLLFGMLHTNVLPGSELFAILLLGLLAVIGGMAIRIVKLPALLGMMVVGFLSRNSGFFPYYNDISPLTISAIRQIALSYILLRAGLELDASDLVKLKMAVLRLTFIPCLVEAACVGVVAHYLLNLPWIFSMMLGFIISAVSPAVILPLILELEGKGFGVGKGIPTMIMAASSLDDVLAITGFTMCFTMAFSTANLAWTIVRGPLEPLVGLAYGAVFGVIFWHFPSRDRRRAIVVYYNVLLMSFTATSNMFASERLGIPGAGPLGCITLAFVSAIAWRKNSRQFAGVQGATEMIWKILEPFLFSFIGAEITFKELGDNAGFGTLSIVLGLICRTIATTLSCIGAGLNWKEKIFVCCAWLPKATVQAAIGSHALYYVITHHKNEEFMQYGITILNVSVLSIFLTAPFGAVLISVLGPCLLAKNIPSRSAEIEESSSTKVLQQEPGPSDYGSIVVGPSADPLVPNV